MEKKGLNRVVILTIGICIGGGITNLLFMNTNPVGVSHSAGFKSDVEFVLNCTLPTDTEISMPTLDVNSPIIDSAEEANDLSEQIFPEYGDAVFEASAEEFNTMVDGENNSWIQIFPSGCLMFTRDSNKTWIDIESFTETEALQIADDFIEDHGGLQGAELETIVPSMLWDENDTFTGEITGYSIFYRFSYDNTKICGGDKIALYIDGNGDVVIYFWMKRDISQSSEMNTIISGEEAYDLLVTSTTTLKDMGTLVINSIELCYYSEPYTENQDTMTPVWAFEYNENHMLIYVDAITGEVK